MNGRMFPILLAAAATGSSPGGAGVPPHPAELRTVALRVHRMDAMEAFYREAFGFRFRSVTTGPFSSRFGTAGELTIKLVPIRDATDFAGFPVHQLGFTVDDVAGVLALAERHGGRVENQPTRDAEGLHASLRDPDGNTIELYGRQ